MPFATPAAQVADDPSAAPGTRRMEIGAFTFADVSRDSRGVGPARRLPELVEEIALADEVGLDVFGIGEHHRPDFAAPAPVVLLAAAASRTSRIRLTSAVSVLGSDDPVRVFEQFSMLDSLSGGRAEIMVGRGALTESFRIFGYDLADYDQLFSEKLDLLLALRTGEPVTWSGRHRSPLERELIHPRPVQNPLPVWLAVGGSANSVVRAGKLGLPLALGIIGGRPADLAPMVALYRDVLARAGHEPRPVAITVHGFVADTSQRAADLYYPGDAEVLNRIGGERGMRPMSRTDFDIKIEPGGAYAVGSPEQVTEQILHLHEAFGHQRTLLQLAIGSVGHRDVMRAIELLGTEVAPAVRSEIARRERTVETGSPGPGANRASGLAGLPLTATEDGAVAIRHVTGP
jgi:probable LLM family oxidoreductase